MKKLIFGVFAHPDDEAFGPAATLLKETKAGSELHLILLTAGEAGMNPDNDANLSHKRLKEWHDAAALLGATGTHYLGYKDGHLNNRSLIKIADQIQEIVLKTAKNAPINTEIEFITFDFSGISGHIDHIVATRAACLVFYRIKPNDSRFTKIRLFCLPKTLYPDPNTDWLYMESGRNLEDIDEVVDARDLKNEILAIMRTHSSQAADCERYLKDQGEHLGINEFIVKS